MDKLRLAVELLEDLEQHPESIPVQEWQKRLLDDRLAKHGDGPEPGIAWEELKRRLLAEIG